MKDSKSFRVKANHRLGPPARIKKMRQSPRRNRRWQEGTPGRQPRRPIVEPATQVERPPSLEGSPFARSFVGTFVSFHLDPRSLPHQHRADPTQVRPTPDGRSQVQATRARRPPDRRLDAGAETNSVLHKMPVIPTERRREPPSASRSIGQPCSLGTRESAACKLLSHYECIGTNDRAASYRRKRGYRSG